MQQVGAGASALSQTGPLHHQGHKEPTDAPQVEMANFSSWKRGKLHGFTWEILAREIEVVGSKLLWIKTLIFADNIFRAFKVAGGPQTKKRQEETLPLRSTACPSVWSGGSDHRHQDWGCLTLTSDGLVVRQKNRAAEKLLLVLHSAWRTSSHNDKLLFFLNKICTLQLNHHQTLIELRIKY